MTPIPLLALALALVGAVCLVLLIWNRRWPDLAIVLLAGGALALYLEHGRRGPDRIGALVAEVVNADRSLSLHVRVEPGTPVWCSSVFSVESAPAGEPARDSADWRVDLHPTERSDAKPLDADAAGRAVVTLPAPLVESAPNRAVHVWFNGTDNGTTRLEPPAESEPHAESAEPRPGDRRALENRRDQLAKRLERPGTLVPYAEVAVIDLPPATVEELASIPKIAFRLAVVAYEPEVQTISHPASVPETLDELLARARASGEDRVFECPLQGRPAALTHDGQRTSVQIWLDGKDHVTTSEPGPAVEVSFTPKIAENGAIDADVSMRWFSERRGSDSLASSSVCHQVFMPGRVEELGGSLLPRNGKDKKFFRAFLELNIQKNPATNAAPAHPATPSPAASESHAESAEAAESGSPAGGAGERSETEGVSHAENAETAEL